MRTLVAIAIFAGSIFVLEAPSEAAPKDKRSVDRYYAPRYSREEVECERARYADPSGVYGGYPCWAQAAFGPKGGRTRR
jgi:hypothetical protein